MHKQCALLQVNWGGGKFPDLLSGKFFNLVRIYGALVEINGKLFNVGKFPPFSTEKIFTHVYTEQRQDKKKFVFLKPRRLQETVHCANPIRIFPPRKRTAFPSFIFFSCWNDDEEDKFFLLPIKTIIIYIYQARQTTRRSAIDTVVRHIYYRKNQNLHMFMHHVFTF